MKNVKIIGFLTGLAFLVSSFIAIGNSKNDPPTTEGGYKIGDVATDFKLKNIDERIPCYCN